MVAAEHDDAYDSQIITTAPHSRPDTAEGGGGGGGGEPRATTSSSGKSGKSGKSSKSGKSGKRSGKGGAPPPAVDPRRPLPPPPPKLYLTSVGLTIKRLRRFQASFRASYYRKGKRDEG